MPPDPLSAISQLQHFVLIIVGVSLPLLALLRAAEDGEIVRLCLGLVACVAYLASAWRYGVDVLVVGGWACVALGAVLIARGLIRERLDRARPRSSQPDPAQIALKDRDDS